MEPNKLKGKIKTKIFNDFKKMWMDILTDGPTNQHKHQKVRCKGADFV